MAVTPPSLPSVPLQGLTVHPCGRPVSSLCMLRDFTVSLHMTGVSGLLHNSESCVFCNSPYVGFLVPWGPTEHAVGAHTFLSILKALWKWSVYLERGPRTQKHIQG